MFEERSKTISRILINRLSYHEIPSEFKNDTAFLLMMVRRTPSVIKQCGVGANREFMLRAVSSFGRSLEYASDALKRDKELVMCAVMDDGGALRFASDELKNDIDVVSIACMTGAGAIKLCGASIRHNRDLMLIVAIESYSGICSEFINSEYKRDKGFILDVCEKRRDTVIDIPHELMTRDFAFELLKRNVSTYRYFIDSIKFDREVALFAVTLNGKVVKYDSFEPFWDDKELITIALKTFRDAIKYASYDIKADRELLYGMRAPSLNVRMRDIRFNFA